MSSASRGLAPREGLELLLEMMGHTRPLVEPRRGPQAGKSGDPRSQYADSSPRDQGTIELGFEAKPKGKCGAPRAPTSCGHGWRMAIYWTWTSPLPHTASATAGFVESLPHAKKSHDYLRSWRPTVGLPWVIKVGGRRPPLHISLHPRASSSSLLQSPIVSHGADEEVLGHGEGNGLSERAWLPSAQARLRSPP